MDVRPLDCLESDDLCKFELFGLTNSAMMPVMITMAPTTLGLQQTQECCDNPPMAPIASAVSATSFLQQQQQQQQQYPSSIINSPSHISLLPKMTTTKLQENHHHQQFEHVPTKNVIRDAYKKFPVSSHHHALYYNSIVGGGGGDVSGVIDEECNNDDGIGTGFEGVIDGGISCELHGSQRKLFTQKFMKPRIAHLPPATSLTSVAVGTTTLQTHDDNLSPCISKLTLSSKNDGCGAGCNALMMMKIVGGGGSGGGGSSTGSNNSNKEASYANNIKMGGETTYRQRIYDGINEGNIKNCNCMYMGFDSFSPDYQTSGFSCLPDVTEHSNIRRTISRQDSTSISEFGDLTNKDKIKKVQKENKRKYCVFSVSIIFSLILFAIVSALIYQFILIKPSRNSHDQRIKIVQKILKEIPLIDGHNDLAWNVRKYAHNSLELIDLSHKFDEKTIWHKPQWSQTDIPRIKEGLLGAQIWSAFVPCEAQGLDAVQLALEQIDIIHRFTELYPTDFVLAVSSQEILSAHKKGILASLIGIEGGHALGSSLGVLRSLHALGARYLTLTHQCDTPWAGSSYMSMDKGLTLFGKAVIKEMNRLGMMIDLSYSSDATARDVLEVTRAPVIFSHSVARSICNSTRNIPDDILRAVADNGGLIMISFDSQYISCEDSSTIDDVIAHIKYIRSIVGIQHIGIGAGFDGLTNPPKGLEDVSKYPNLFAALLKDNNWSEEDIAMLAGKNFLRVLKSVENVRDYWKRAMIPPVEVTEPIKKSHCTYMSS